MLKKVYGRLFGKHATLSDGTEKISENNYSFINRQMTAASPRRSIPGERDLYSCLKGRIVRLEQVNDSVFASRLIGDGIAVYPEEGILYAPTNGTVTAIFPTGHAVGITTDDGLEILIHIGINTVQLDGTGFHTCVKEGQKVKQGDRLVTFDITSIKRKGFDPVTMLLITNMDMVNELEFNGEDVANPSRIILHVRLKTQTNTVEGGIQA